MLSPYATDHRIHPTVDGYQVIHRRAREPHAEPSRDMVVVATFTEREDADRYITGILCRHHEWIDR